MGTADRQDREQAGQDVGQFVDQFLQAAEIDDSEKAWALFRLQLDRVQADLDLRAGKPVPKSAVSLYDYLWDWLDHDSGEQGVAFHQAIETVADSWSQGDGEQQEVGQALATQFSGEPRDWPAELLELAVDGARLLEARLAKIEESNAELMTAVMRVLEMAKAGGKVTPGQMGVALLVKDPARSAASIARQLECATSTLTRDPVFKLVTQFLRSQKLNVRKGTIDARTGRLDATDETL